MGGKKGGKKVKEITIYKVGQYRDGGAGGAGGALAPPPFEDDDILFCFSTCSYSRKYIRVFAR